MEPVFSELTTQKNFINHFVALTVLRDIWSILAKQVQELETDQ